MCYEVTQNRLKLHMKTPMVYFLQIFSAAILINYVLDVTSIKVPLFSFTPPRKEIAIYPSVHEQEDGTIFALCATGTSGKDSLLSWIRHLEKDGNPILATIPIVFTLKSGETEVTTTSAPVEENKEQKNITDS